MDTGAVLAAVAGQVLPAVNAHPQRFSRETHGTGKRLVDRAGSQHVAATLRNQEKRLPVSREWAGHATCAGPAVTAPARAEPPR